MLLFSRPLRIIACKIGHSRTSNTVKRGSHLLHPRPLLHGPSRPPQLVPDLDAVVITIPHLAHGAQLVFRAHRLSQHACVAFTREILLMSVSYAGTAPCTHNTFEVNCLTMLVPLREMIPLHARPQSPLLIH